MADADDLLALAGAGDERAWRQIVERYQRLVYATIRSFRIAPSEAEDVFQETFLRLHRHTLRVRDSRALPRWLIVTTRRLCLDLLAHERTVTRLAPAFDVVVEDVGEADLIALERAQVVREALAELSPRC